MRNVIKALGKKKLSEIENGKCNISSYLVFKIESYYNISVEGIFENKYRFNYKIKFDAMEDE